MSKDADSQFIQQLERFGFDKEEATLYTHLLSKGERTALHLSRELKKPRTRVYRILDSLIEKGFVIEVVEDRGRKFKAAEVERFDQFIEDKKQDISQLTLVLPDIKESVEQLKDTVAPQSKIINYRGKDGIEQINWNSTKTDDILRIFEQPQQMENWMPHKKAERLREEFDANNVIVHQLTNETSVADYTKVAGHAEKCFTRFVDPITISLQNDLILYDNVVATYSQNEDDYFGVEIHDETIATILKQMFDHFWEIGTPLKMTSPYGAAEVTD